MTGKVLVIFLLFLGILGTGVWIWKTKLWDGQTRFTVVSLGDVVKIKSFDPVTALGVEIILPPSLIVSSTQGRGEWLVSKITRAGDEKWVISSLTNTLGLVILENENKMPLIDKILWKWWEKRVVWKQIDVSNLGFLVGEVTPDGKKVYRLAGAWDKYVADSLSSVAIARLGIDISIVNTTGVAGLAASASRLVESMGYRVTEVSSSDNKIDRCRVYSKMAIRPLMTVFDCEWMKDEGSGIKLELGEKYRKWRDG